MGELLRIEYAKELILKHPYDPLEYIASQAGFSSASQFSRKFKELTGITPRSWQQVQHY